jgi:hypothetical protein
MTTRRMCAAGLVWFVVMTGLGAAGAFVVPAGAPPVTLGLAAGLPPVVALGLLAGSHRFRAWAQGLDLRLLTVLQSWRAGGLAFLALVAVGALPPAFALPAGLGDVLVGLTAPVVAALRARGTLGASAYVGWTAFGVVDLVAAVTLGVLYSDSAVGLLTRDVDTTIMAGLPMSIVPTFFVPFLLVVHILSLVVVRARTLPSDGAGAGHDRGAATLSR